MCKVSVHGVFLCVHPGAKYLSRLGHISYKDEPSESMNLPWKYECDTLLQKHSAQKVPLPCPLHANNLKAKKMSLNSMWTSVGVDTLITNVCPA